MHHIFMDSSARKLRPLPGRESQLKQLTLLLPPNSGPTNGTSSAAPEQAPGPPAVVVHGPEATGKSALISSFLSRSRRAYVHLQCRECMTARHLFEKAIAECKAVANGDPDSKGEGQRCESISVFAVMLQEALANVDRFVLVLDGVDELREAAPSLVPAMLRLGETNTNLTVILVVRQPSPRYLRATGVPHIYFPPYNREQASAILSLDPLPIYPIGHEKSENFSEDQAKEDDLWLWSRFCQTVWDSLAKGAANDIISFRALCDRLWRPFVQPIVAGTFGTRDFSRLVVAQRSLLQDERYLEDDLLIESDGVAKHDAIHDFPYFTKWLLCAAYLASHNPARLDTLHFMKATERKRRKKGGGTAAGRQAKTRKIPRHLLSPAAFGLDRLFAILHSILPHDMVSGIDLYTQIATLHALRLVIRSGMYGGDPLDRGAKWRVTYDWDYVLGIARSLNFDITDYVAE